MVKRTQTYFPQKHKGNETLAQAMKRIGQLGEPGPKDLATNVDAYLYGGKK